MMSVEQTEKECDMDRCHWCGKQVTHIDKNQNPLTEKTPYGIVRDPSVWGDLLPRKYADVAWVERALRQLWPRRPGTYQRWALASEAFGCGSTFAMLLCREFGLDPDEYITREQMDHD